MSIIAITEDGRVIGKFGSVTAAVADPKVPVGAEVIDLNAAEGLPVAELTRIYNAVLGTQYKKLIGAKVDLVNRIKLNVNEESPVKREKKPRMNVKQQLRDMLLRGERPTFKELVQKFEGCSPTYLLVTLSNLKSKRYCGKGFEPMNIIKGADGRYEVVAP